jgi:hypothetical protein
MKPPKWPKQNGQNKTAETTENINYRKNGCKILKYEFYGNFFWNCKTIGGGGGADNPEDFDYTEY